MSALPQQLERVFFALCEDAGTPVAARLKKAVQDREYGQLVAETIDPGNYESADSYMRDAGVVEFFRKFGDFDLPEYDKQAAALKSFEDAERANAKTNLRLAPFVNNGPFQDPDDLRLFESIERMQKWLAKVLGPIPQGDWKPKLGPGSTFRDIGLHTTVPDKFSSRPTVTSSCVDLLPFWHCTAWAEMLTKSYPSHSDPEIIRGNRFTTVPKNSKTYRGICIEGSINIYFQLDIGAQLAECLKGVGIDKEKAQEVHRRVAEYASRTGLISTIDLSNASDMNSYMFVKLMLAKAGHWFDHMESCRSPLTLVNGKWRYLEKFSSMGNGYTFELETLLFLALAMEACYLAGINGLPGRNVFVYGDDIALPTAAAPTMLTLLRFFGHKPNESKTFLEGPFRESCGGDYFKGTAVRPFNLEETPDEPAKWISLANGIRRMGCQNPGVVFRWSIYWRAWLRALDALPADIRRLRGPSSLGDLVIHDDPEYWYHRRTPDCRSYIRTWMPFTKAIPFHHWKPDIVLASALYGIDSNSRLREDQRTGKIHVSHGGVVPRDSVAGYRMKWVAAGI